MAFDADKYVEALEPPTITIGGETHRGKILSFHQALSFATKYDDMAGQEVPATEVESLAREMFNLAYPEEVTEQILELPMGAVQEALEDFLESQLQSTNGKKDQTT